MEKLINELEQTKRELEQLSYEDVLVQMNSLFEQYGVRAVMTDFHRCYPAMFDEVLVQITRIKPDKQLPALLK